MQKAAATLFSGLNTMSHDNLSALGPPFKLQRYVFFTYQTVGLVRHAELFLKQFAKL
jgi:hypothetical protein